MVWCKSPELLVSAGILAVVGATMGQLGTTITNCVTY